MIQAHTHAINSPSKLRHSKHSEPFFQQPAGGIAARWKTNYTFVELAARPRAMAKDSFTIRRLAPDAALQADLWHAVRALCCLTGNNGRPINTERRDFFPKIW